MYVFQADTYCDSCGEAIASRLTVQGLAPEDPEDERSYDSDDYPKGPVPEEATDGPDHCAAGVDCLEPLDLFDYGLTTSSKLHGTESTHIGALLSDGVTEAGVSYLCEMLEENSDTTPYQRALHAYWREVFADDLATVQA